jgi:hypothetical protein
VGHSAVTGTAKPRKGIAPPGDPCVAQVGGDGVLKARAAPSLLRLAWLLVPGSEGLCLGSRTGRGTRRGSERKRRQGEHRSGATESDRSRPFTPLPLHRGFFGDVERGSRSRFRVSPMEQRFLRMSGDQAETAQSLPIEPGRSNWLHLVRNKKQRERYGPAHLRRRREFVRGFGRGEIIPCLRCGGDLDCDSDRELDQDDHDPSQSYPSHRSCNRGAPHRNVTSREW